MEGVRAWEGQGGVRRRRVKDGGSASEGGLGVGWGGGG